MMEKALELAEKSGTLSATLHVVKTRLELEDNQSEWLLETIKYIDQQLKKVGE